MRMKKMTMMTMMNMIRMCRRLHVPAAVPAPLVVVSGVISGYQHYLLQRAGTGVVYSSRRQLIARIFRLPISQFDTRRTGDLVVSQAAHEG